MPTRPMQPQRLPAPTQWQGSPVAAAPRPLPTKTRGVMAEVPPKFVLPSPEALGVSTSLKLRETVAEPKAPVDWNMIQTRLERLRVLRYEKDRPNAGVVRVKLLLPTSDPTRGQPVEAQAETEAEAVILALNAAEAWALKR